MRLKSCQVFFHRHQATERSSVLWLLLYVPLQAFHIILLYHFGARCLPNMGKHVTQHGQARYPTWARLLHGCCPFVPNMADSVWAFLKRLNFTCPLVVLDEPRVSVPPRMITHPNLPKGKGQVTLQLITVNHISPHLASKPILPFPKGRNKLLCFVKDFSKSIQPMNISPHSFSNPS